ncbi:MAG: hypothetical protein HY074_17825 [Deltaproteobacteria bacterium]|nr:hypothetical protein [Deltaproteobacteria bacterium]
MNSRLLTYKTIALVLAALATSCASGERKISSGGEPNATPGNILDSPGAAERHGCCGSNGGACGCGGGKVKCCDGTFSANCACE